MNELEYMPQNSRFEAILLGFLGGALDVYCQIQFDTLVATQTGNILFLIADISHSPLQQTLIRLFSVLFFSIGFMFGLHVRANAKTAFWRVYALLPLLIVTMILPLLPDIRLLWVVLLALATGLLTLTFSGSQIESHAYSILMTSGNYRKMITAWHQYFNADEKTCAMKRQAINYSLVVISFVIGAITTAILYHFTHEKTIWIVTLNLACIICHYSSVVVRYRLQACNI